MARRKKHEEHVNHEAWAIPYGDLVTLLLAFFVVMYAMSTVNEGKYRVLSDSLVAAFRSAPKSLEPIQVGNLSRARYGADVSLQRTLVPLEIDSQLDQQRSQAAVPAEVMRFVDVESPEQAEAAEALIGDLTDLIADRLADLVDEGLVEVRRFPYWLEVEINTRVLFDSASAEVGANFVSILTRLSDILAGSPTRIHVEGHTDSQPIRSSRFPSNWELSAARAARVVRLFADNGVDPETMAAVGLGAHRPAADNATPEGRSRNRRVVIVVMAHKRALLRESWPAIETST